MSRAVRIIPATKNKFTALPTASIAKRRVAAYARVSTDSDEQFTSYEAQIDYYTQYIKKRLSPSIPTRASPAVTPSTEKGSTVWCRMPLMGRLI